MNFLENTIYKLGGYFTMGEVKNGTQTIMLKNKVTIGKRIKKWIH
jgi:hypothetical protein